MIRIYIYIYVERERERGRENGSERRRKIDGKYIFLCAAQMVLTNINEIDR